MSWSFSPALVAAFSEANCSGIEPCAPSSSTPTPDQFYWPDKPTEYSRLSRFGMTCEPLTADRGAALLTWYLAGFPAKTSALPERVQESTGSAAGYGGKWRALLARYDPTTHGWKIVQRSLLEGSDALLATWPRSGMTADGQCWELPMSEPHTAETGYGFSHPTPTARDYKGASNGQKLNYSRWTTWLHHAISHGHYTTYPNPSCSEAVMGWPIGHTALKPSAMARCRNAAQQHGECSEAVSA
jgi:hypothetical protein